MGHKTQRIKELEEQVTILMQQLREKCAENSDLKRQVSNAGWAEEAHRLNDEIQRSGEWK